MMQNFKFHLMADKAAHPRIRVRKADGSGHYLINPNTGKHEPLPLIGIRFLSPSNEPIDPPQSFKIGHSKLLDFVDRGVVTVKRSEDRTAPGGPANNPGKKVHSFPTIEHATFHCPGGSVRYRVTRQAGKYYVDGQVCDMSSDSLRRYRQSADEKLIVDWTLTLELEG